MTQIFADFAPLYWNAGLPVIPLKKRQKAPILNEWSSYSTHFPSIAERDHWLHSYRDSNIGLPFGEASGLCAIDIDTEDQATIDTIMDILPASPWTRIGKKGCGLIFKWQGQKNFKVRSEQGMLCEFLGRGNQMVMPPSIHPDCGECGQKNAAGPAGVCVHCGAPSLVYTSNTNLWEVIDRIQPLGIDIEERLRAALGVKGVKLAHEGRSGPMVVVPAGERDIMMVRQAGYLARVVLGIDKQHQFTLAEAIDQMYTWVQDKTASMAGDDMDPEKGVAKLLEFLLKDVEGGKTMPNGWDEGLTAAQLENPAIKAMGVSNESQRWTRTKAREWLSEQAELRPDDDDWLLDKIQELVGHIAKDDQFTDMQLDAVYGDIKTRYGKIMTKPAFNKAFREARSGGTEEADADHEAIGRRVLDDLNRYGEIRHAGGRFWQWNGSCFVELNSDVVYRRVMQVKNNVLCRRANDYASIVKVVATQAAKELVEEDSVLGVNFANGFLDIDGVLHEHSPRFGKTFTMPFNYAPERAGSCHKWLAFLESCWGDDADYADKVAALQEAFAATMFGNACDFQRAILLFGQAGTGKSTVMNVLQAMMPPEAVCSIPPHNWGQRFVLSGMVGRTLNCCGELSESAPIAGDKFKEIVEGTSQRTEFKGENSFVFTPIAANWFASNFLPITRDGSKGFLRRWLILGFDRVVRPEERIVNFHQHLVAEEREAIAAWATQAIGRLVRRQDFTLPASHEELIGSVRRANNDVAAWLQTNNKVVEDQTPGMFADGQSCYEHFRWFMRNEAGMNGGRIANFERFMQMMKELGFRNERYTDAVGQVRFKLFGVRSSIPLGLAA